MASQAELKKLGIETNYPQYYNSDGTYAENVPPAYFGDHIDSCDCDNPECTRGSSWCGSCRVYSRNCVPYGTCQCS